MSEADRIETVALRNMLIRKDDEVKALREQIATLTAEVRRNDKVKLSLCEAADELRADLDTALMFVESNKDLVATLAAERDCARNDMKREQAIAAAALGREAALRADVERLTKELSFAQGQVAEALKFEPNWKTHTAQIAAIETLLAAGKVLRDSDGVFTGDDDAWAQFTHAHASATDDYAKKADEVES